MAAVSVPIKHSKAFVVAHWAAYQRVWHKMVRHVKFRCDLHFFLLILSGHIAGMVILSQIKKQTLEHADHTWPIELAS